MKYEVIVTAGAAAELEEAYDWLVAQTPQNAPQWYNGLLEALLSLDASPARCPLAEDREPGDGETRHLLYGDKRHAFRIISAIRGEKVLVWHIRHAARRQG